MQEYKSPLTKKERLILLRCLKSISLQDVNANENHKIDNQINIVLTEKVFPLFLSKQKINRVTVTDPINLNNNIDIHNDSNYITSNKLESTAYLLIFDLKHKKVDYLDSPKNTYFIHDKKFTELNPITSPHDKFYVIPFNATIDHGLMLNGELRGFIIFLYKYNL